MYSVLRLLSSKHTRSCLRDDIKSSEKISILNQFKIARPPPSCCIFNSVPSMINHGWQSLAKHSSGMFWFLLYVDILSPQNWAC